MSDHKPNQEAMNDAEVETLLFDFFQREMPSRLSGFPGSSLQANRKSSLVERVAAPVTQPGRAAGVGVVVVTVCLVVALMAVFSPDPKRPVADQDDSKKSDPDAAIVSQDSAAEGLVIETVEESWEPTERLTYDTTDGPVELRIERPITNVKLFDPASGTNVEVEFPGIEIEIILIDDDE